MLFLTVVFRTYIIDDNRERDLLLESGTEIKMKKKNDYFFEFNECRKNVFVLLLRSTVII